MRITVGQLRRIIKEEMGSSLGAEEKLLTRRTDTQELAELLNFDYDAIRFSDNPGPEEKAALRTLQSAVRAINSGKSTASQVAGILSALDPRFVIGNLPGSNEEILQNHYT